MFCYLVCYTFSTYGHSASSSLGVGGGGASNDGGQTFGDKINLSNTTNANSTRAEIDSGANSVVVIWWETNQTGDTPVMRLSSDNGATFGPLLQLGTNATIGQSE
jgi:hypothetical protein